MTAPFKISVITSEARKVRINCTMAKAEVAALSEAGLKVNGPGEASVLGFFVVAFITDSCPCAGCLLETVKLPVDETIRHLESLAEAGYVECLEETQELVH